MFMENCKYMLVRVGLVTILMAGMFGIHPVQADAIDFGQSQNMDGPNLDYEAGPLRGGGGPGPVTLISPTGTSKTKTPTYTWNQAVNATWYQLWVHGPSGAVIKIWYTSKEANCNGDTCSVKPNKRLSSGTYTWGVQTWNEVGFGEWRKTGFVIP